MSNNCRRKDAGAACLQNVGVILRGRDGTRWDGHLGSAKVWVCGVLIEFLYSTVQSTLVGRQAGRTVPNVRKWVFFCFFTEMLVSHNQIIITRM